MKIELLIFQIGQKINYYFINRIFIFNIFIEYMKLEFLINLVNNFSKLNLTIKFYEI
jgi:hypothetical protein